MMILVIIDSIFMNATKIAKIAYLLLSLFALACLVIHFIYEQEWAIKVVGIYITLSILLVTIKPDLFILHSKDKQK